MAVSPETAPLSVAKDNETIGKEELAGVVGFEPTIHGTKNRCLTAWLHPNSGGDVGQSWERFKSPSALMRHNRTIGSQNVDPWEAELVLFASVSCPNGPCDLRITRPLRWLRCAGSDLSPVEKTL